MAKKDVIARITVNNAGLDFSDDVYFVLVTVPAELKLCDVYKEIESADKELHEENDEGECGYDYEGWNALSLMDKVCEKNDWSWRYIMPEIDFTIG